MPKQYRVGYGKVLIEDRQRVRLVWRPSRRVQVRAEMVLLVWAGALVAGMFIGAVLATAR